MTNPKQGESGGGERRVEGKEHFRGTDEHKKETILETERVSEW